MILVITLTKNVADKAEAEGLTQIVREKLVSTPDVNIKAETLDRLPENPE